MMVSPESGSRIGSDATRPSARSPSVGDGLAALDHRLDRKPGCGAAVVLDDDAVLGDIDEAAGEIARVGGLERRVGEALARPMRGVEVLEHRQPFLEVGLDRRLDDLAGGLGHQAAHAGELLHLRFRAARAGIGHDVDRVERGPTPPVLAHGEVGHALHHRRRHLVRALRPGVDDLVVLLALGDEAVGILTLVAAHLAVGEFHQLGLVARHHHVVLAEGDAGAGRVAEAEIHHLVGEDHGLLLAAMAVDGIEHGAELALGEQLIDRLEADVGVLRQHLREDQTARRGLDPDGVCPVLARPAAGDLGMQRDHASVERLLHLADVGERHALAALAVTGVGEVVDAEHDVLARHDDRLAVGGAQDVVGGHHQHPRLELRLGRERHVHRHLVAVEVGVEGGADQRVKLDRLALDQHRLEGLDAEAVQRRRPVEQHRMLADHLLQDVPDLGPLLLDHALGGLERGGHAVEFELGIDEGLEQLERHLLRQAALVQLELRPDHDHRAARIVDALAQQVLPEAPLLALQHVAQRLQRALVGAGHHPAPAAVVKERVHRLLQHALLIADDDVGRAQLDQPLQAGCCG